MTPLPQTEAADDATSALDRLSTLDLVATLVESQRGAVVAVESARDAIARAVDEIAKRLRSGGHLHYIGAGTSGRLGTLDAAEMPPTFGTDPMLVQAHIAGGPNALVRAVEGAEDDEQAGREVAETIGAHDAAVGISASGGASFVVAAIVAARARGAYTIAIVDSMPSALGDAAEQTILLPTGAEPLAGSTRLRAGTAQKIALNTISTAVMVRLGKVYGNLMVDLVATNKKLRERARRLVMHVAGVDEAEAERLLEASGGSVKCAIVMARRNVSAEEARALLEQHGGVLRKVL
jgi:N-acetylmuramic acid 6-phosphate etherase